MGKHNKLLGDWGEARAKEYLEKKGYVILTENYRCPLGEIDLIATIKDQLIFIEVKTRRSLAFGYPSEAVNSKKRTKYYKTALYFIQDNGGLDTSYRFDIIEVFAPAWGEFTINHLENAFNFRTSRYFY